MRRPWSGGVNGRWRQLDRTRITVDRLAATAMRIAVADRVASSGWAPRGAGTAVNGAYKRDPFSRACLAMRPGRILVGTRQGHYGVGPEIPSHCGGATGRSSSRSPDPSRNGI